MSLTIAEIKTLLNAGLKPAIRFTKDIAEHEAYAEPGMCARIVGLVMGTGMGTRIDVDFSEYEKHNEGFETTNYFDKDMRPVLTARQAGLYKQQDRYWGGEALSDTFPAVLLAQGFHTEYKDSGSPKTYAEWLEDQVTALRAQLGGAK